MCKSKYICKNTLHFVDGLSRMSRVLIMTENCGAWHGKQTQQKRTENFIKDEFHLFVFNADYMKLTVINNLWITPQVLD